MSFARTLVVATLIATVASPPASAFGWFDRQDPAEALVVQVQNRVELWPQEGPQRSAVPNDTVAAGDSLYTYDDSSCRILFMEDAFIDIGANTRYTLTTSEITGAGRRGLFDLAVGKMRLALGRLFGRGTSAEIRTPTAVIGVKGTDVYVDYDADLEETLVLVSEGSVDVFSRSPQVSGVVVTVPGGSFTRVASGSAPTPAAPASAALVASTVQVLVDPAVEPDESEVGAPAADVAAEQGDLTSDDGPVSQIGDVLDQPLPEVLPVPVDFIPPDECPGCPESMP